MSNIFGKLVDLFSRGTSLMRLIYINVAVFVVVKLLLLVLMLFNVNGMELMAYLELPSDLHRLLYQPLSVVTYMFFHIGIGHLFFNVLALYWFGRIALEYYSQKQLVAIYLIGGLFGALVYIMAYNLFPYFRNMVDHSYLLGASGAVLAICTAVATVKPNYPVRIMFIGEIKLVWLAAVMVIVSLLGITGSNAGGEFAHLGGALVGYLYAEAWKRGKDWSVPVNRIIDRMVNLVKRKPKIKVSKSKAHAATRIKTDAEYNREKRENSAAIDAILDKIKQRGYESLTAEEKRELFDRSRNNY